MKLCTKCGVTKSLESFAKRKGSKDGLQWRCRDCKRADRARWYRVNKDKFNKIHSAWRGANPERIMLIRAKHRAKKLGLPFDLKSEDIHIPAHCPILGIPLNVREGKSGPSDNSPSLDRIDPDLGYIRSNVQVISGKANRIKNDATPEELMKVAEFMNKTLANFMR